MDIQFETYSKFSFLNFLINSPTIFGSIKGQSAVILTITSDLFFVIKSRQEITFASTVVFYLIFLNILLKVC